MKAWVLFSVAFLAPLSCNFAKQLVAEDAKSEVKEEFWARSLYDMSVASRK